MCQIERLKNREENGGNTPDRYRACAPWNSIKMHIYGFLQSTKGLKSPFHFEDGGYEIDSATLLMAPNGELLSTCNSNKAMWYVEKQLGDIVSEEGEQLKVRLRGP